MMGVKHLTAGPDEGSQTGGLVKPTEVKLWRQRQFTNLPAGGGNASICCLLNANKLEEEEVNKHQRHRSLAAAAAVFFSLQRRKTWFRLSSGGIGRCFFDIPATSCHLLTLVSVPHPLISLASSTTRVCSYTDCAQTFSARETQTCVGLRSGLRSGLGPTTHDDCPHLVQRLCPTGNCG